MNKEELIISLDRAAATIDGEEACKAELMSMRGFRERLAQNRFQLAVLGQLKRGKSTLINALIGQEILPSSVIPVTAIPTFLSWGSAPKVEVRYLAQRSKTVHFGSPGELRAFLINTVSEEKNPCNVQGISQVEVFYPSPFLESGVVLLDTPGIGSTHAHNTETALAVLSECDGALFLVSADPPITAVEVDFLAQIQTQVGRVFYLLNKIDNLREEEEQKATEFLREVLAEKLGVHGPQIFNLSARQGLEARLTGDPVLWEKSGLAQISKHLVGFLAAEKETALVTALGRKLHGVLGGALLKQNLKARSLEIPLSQLEQKLQVFKAKLAEAEKQRLSMGDLLKGEQRRSEQFLEQQASALRSEALREIGKRVEDRLAILKGENPEKAVQEFLDSFVPAYFARELKDMARVFASRLETAFTAYQKTADEIIETVGKTAARLFDLPYTADAAADYYQEKYQPYWVTNKITSVIAPLPTRFINKLLPRKIQSARQRKEYTAKIQALVTNNVENLRWATLQNLREAYRLFTADLERRLEEIAAATKGTMEAAAQQRRRQAHSFQMEIAAVRKTVENLTALRKSLEELG